MKVLEAALDQLQQKNSELLVELERRTQWEVTGGLAVGHGWVEDSLSTILVVVGCEASHTYIILVVVGCEASHTAPGTLSRRES